MIFSTRSSDQPVLQQKLEAESVSPASSDALHVESLDRECRTPRPLFPKNKSASDLHFGRLFPDPQD